VAAANDAAVFLDTGYFTDDSAFLVGGTGTSSASSGQGFRVLNVTIPNASTVNSCKLTLVKRTTQFSTMNDRWTVDNEDNCATFADSSGNRPGERPIDAAHIVAESPNRNETDGTSYDFPTTGTLQTNLGAAAQTVINRAGWASGNAFAILNNNHTNDASASSSFGRKFYHGYNGGVSSPSITIDYTASASQDTPELYGRPEGRRGQVQMAQLLAT
jgi:hypothetical protein